MITFIFRYKNIFWQLLKKDLLVIKGTLADKIINAFIWVSTTIIIAENLLPMFGITSEYALFSAVGTIASCSGFTMFPKIAEFISDLEGDRHISYQFTLPLPNLLLFMEYVIVFMVNSFILTVSTFITSKMILWDKFILSSICYFKLIIASLFINFFFGCFTFCIISFTKSMVKLDNVWMRYIYPLWIFGCFQFSWKSLHSVSPFFAYIDLLNPYVHATESMRAAIINPQLYLPFWPCIVALIALSGVSGWWGFWRLKKQLDFV
jgi:ABC-2 type transport system permease protein